MNTSITPTEIRTSDTFFASYLLATDVALRDVVREGRRVIFVFAVEDGQAIQVAYVGGAEVSARAHADAYVRLRQLIHDMVPGGAL